MSFKLLLEQSECTSLYAHLKKREAELDAPLEKLLQRVEAVLFEHLSIEEVEALSSGENQQGEGK